jgi:hypothetical protein
MIASPCADPARRAASRASAQLGCQSHRGDGGVPLRAEPGGGVRQQPLRLRRQVRQLRGFVAVLAEEVDRHPVGRFDGQREVTLQHPPRRRSRFARTVALGQLRRVHAEQVVQPVSRLARGVGSDQLDEVGVHQHIEDFVGRSAAQRRGDHPRRELHGAERADPAERRGRRHRQQVVAQGHAGAHGEVADPQLVEPPPFVVQPVGQHPQRPVRPVGQLRPGHADRQRQVAALAQDRGGVVRLGGDALGPDDALQQLGRFGFGQQVDVHRDGAVEVRQAQAAGHQHRARPGARQQRPHLGRAARVVQHHAHPLPGEPGAQQRRALRQVTRQARVRDSQRPQQLREHAHRRPRRRRGAGQVDVQLAVGERVTHRVRDADRDRGLADPRRARQHDHRGQPVRAALAQPRDDPVHHLLAAGEVRQVEGQLADRQLGGPPDLDFGGQHRQFGRFGGRHGQGGPQLAQPFTGLRAEFLVEGPLRQLVGLDGFVGPAAVAQSRDELLPEFLAQRVFGDQAAQLGDRFAVAAQLDPGFQPPLLDRQPQLGQPGDGRAPAVVVRQALQHLAAPQRIRLFEQSERRFRVAAIECFLRFGGVLAENDMIQFFRRGAQLISRRATADPVAQLGRGFGQPAAQRMDVGTDIGRRGTRRRARPEHLDQHLGGHHDVRLQNQCGQQQPRLRPAQRDGPAFSDDLQRSENPESQ